MDGMMMTILSRSNNPLKEMIMKKNSFLKLGLIGLLALAISGCNGFEEQKLPDEKVSPDEPFSIIVSPETKTQMSGDNNVVWKDEDAITVFVASKGSSDFIKNYKFERKTTGNVNSFYCNDLVGVPGTQNDWYVFYPYTAKIGTPMNSSEPVIVGSAANGWQTQAGNSSRAHLAGDNIPLYGKDTFDAGVVPTITLFQALSVIKVRVTNNTADPLTVSEVSFTAPEAIVGSFAIDFSGDNPIFTVPAGQEENKVSNTATLTVDGGSAIAKGESADFYLAIKPFTANKDDQLILKVNEESRTLTMPSSVSFESGLIKTLNFYELPIPDGNYLVLAKDGEKYYALKAEKEEGKERLLSEAYTGSLESYFGDEKYIWAIQRNGGSYTFSNSGKYLGYKGSNNESYWLEDDEDWTKTNYLLDIITKQETDGSYYVTLASNSSRYLSKNSSSNFFAFYGNTGQKADIVFVPAEVDTRSDVTLSFNNEIVSLSTTEAQTYLGQDVSISPNETAVSDNLSWSYTDNSGVIDEFDEGVLTLTGNQGTAVVTVSFPGDENYRPAEASYTIEVVASGVVTLTDSEITMGNNTVKGTNNTKLAYRLGTGSNNGSITFGSGYSTITFTLAGWASGTRSFSITNGTINDASSLSPDAGGPSGNINEGFATSYSGTEYTIVVTDPEQEVVFSGRRAVVWGFTATLDAPDTRQDAGMSWSSGSATATYNTGNTLSFTAPTLDGGNASSITYESSDETIATINASTGVVTITAPNNNVVNEGSTVISAIFAGDETYKPQTVSYTLTVADNRASVDAPTFSPAAGEVAANTEVTISYADGATVYYTVNNTTPTASSTEYTGPITIDVAKTIKAIATKTGYKPSTVAEAAYTISGVAPKGSETNPYTASEAYAAASGTEVENVYVKGIVSAITAVYSSKYNNVSFTISDDGLTSSTQFTAFRTAATSEDDVLVGDCVILKGTLKLYNSTTPELLAGNTIEARLSMPTFTSGDENFVTSTSVALTVAEGATIHYTTDGTTPTIESAVYASAINLSSTTTINAIAEKDGLVTGVASKTFTKLQSYALTWSTPSNGTLVVKQGETTITSGTMVPENATINITATPDDGYTLSTLVYNDGSDDHDIKSAKSFTMPSQAVTIKATFEQSGGTPTEYTDILTASMFAATSTTYTNFSAVSYSGTNHSAAVYAGNSAKDSNGNIQLRSKNSNSGIVSTTSGGRLKSIKITVGSGSNTIDVYGSSTAYSAASDLYGNSKGTKIGSVSATGTITVPDDVDYSFVGIRSNNGAVYITSIEITWED